MPIRPFSASIYACAVVHLRHNCPGMGFPRAGAFSVHDAPLGIGFSALL